MKRIFKVIIAVGILLQSFAFITQVKAQDNSETSVEIVSISQGGEDLELKDGQYIALGVEELKLYFKINKPNKNVEYYFDIINTNEYGYDSGSGFDPKSIDEIQETTIWLNSNVQNSDYILKLYEINKNGERIKEVDEEYFSIELSNHNELNYLNSKLVVSKVEQGGKDIYPTINNWDVSYDLNNYQDVELTLVGENLDNNTKYEFYNNYFSNRERIEYTGEELKNGIKYIIPINIYRQKGIQPVLDLGIYNNNIETYYKKNDGTYLSTVFNFKENEEINVPSAIIKYKDKKLELDNNLEETLYEEYASIQKITPNEYNENEPIVVNVKTKDLEDENYEIKVSILRDNEEVFNDRINVNGLILNNGYDINLNNFKLEIPTDTNNKLSAYEILITVDNVTIRKYLSYRENGRLISSLFYGTGEKTIIRHAGWGGIYGNGLVFEVHDKAFYEYGTMYFHYLGTNFENNTKYNYELYYGENDDENFNITDRKLIKTGTITGKELNQNGIMVPITDKQDLLFPAYMFVVKKGNNLVYYDKSELKKNNTPSLTTIKVKSNNKNVYMQMSNYKFIATKNAPLTIAVDGIGFEDNKNYTYILHDSYNDGKTEKYNFSGKDINNGTASFKISKGKDDSTIRNVGLEVIGDEGYPISWGGIEIEYVDSKKYFPNDIPYVIDNAKDLIKSIKKETSVDDFVTSLDIENGKNVKVYDNTGIKEINGNIGTGMIARITDKYDNNIMDLDVVVKGDVTGDGNITITDLVNVAQHLSENKKLDNLYEIAGNVTDSGEIGITDVIQISQDVANIKEVK